MRYLIFNKSSLLSLRTKQLMPSDKCCWIMAIAIRFISTLFNITSFRDMPFCQPQQLQCLHHGSDKAQLCSPKCSIPFSIPFSLTVMWQIAVCTLWLWCQAGLINQHTHFQLIAGTHLDNQNFLFFIMAGMILERLFMLLFILWQCMTGWKSVNMTNKISNSWVPIMNYNILLKRHALALEKANKQV